MEVCLVNEVLFFKPESAWDCFVLGQIVGKSVIKNERTCTVVLGKEPQLESVEIKIGDLRKALI